MKFQAFHVNPGEKLKKKDVNNDLSNFMSVFPIIEDSHMIEKKLIKRYFEICNSLKKLLHSISS